MDSSNMLLLLLTYKNFEAVTFSEIVSTVQFTPVMVVYHPDRGIFALADTPRSDST